MRSRNDTHKVGRQHRAQEESYNLHIYVRDTPSSIPLTKSFFQHSSWHNLVMRNKPSPSTQLPADSIWNSFKYFIFSQWTNKCPSNFICSKYQWHHHVLWSKSKRSNSSFSMTGKQFAYLLSPPYPCLSLDQSVTEIDIRSRGIFDGVCCSWWRVETPAVTETRPWALNISPESGQLWSAVTEPGLALPTQSGLSIC